MTDIQHLYWRAGFGLSPEEWEKKKNWSNQKAVNELFDQAKNNQSLLVPRLDTGGKRFQQLSDEEKKELLKKSRQSVAEQNIAWIQRMGNPEESALLERMSLFWHGHFACRSRSGQLAIQQLNTIREHALGDFKSLVLGIARDPAMIRYLNNQQNRKEQPNENFARELMELFTIGRGHYSEADIKEAARAFTGWSSNLRGEFVFRKFWHDAGTKSFFGKKGRFGGEDIIDIILEQRETANFICTKIYKYFVNSQPNEQHINRLSQRFYQSGYDIADLMRHIFTSDWFYDARNQGIKIKSPVELMAGMIRSFDLSFAKPASLVLLSKSLGQVLFNPPNVAGWPGGKSWIDNSTLMMRLNIPSGLIGSTEFSFQTKASLEDKEQKRASKKLDIKANLAPLVKMARTNSKEQSLQALSDYLLQKKPSVPTGVIDRYSPVKDPEEFLTLASIRLMSLPEYQLC